MKPIFSKVDCIRLYVPDLQQGYEFYHDKLGLELEWKTEKGMGFLFGDGVTELVIQNGDKYQETDLKVDSVETAVNQIQQSGGKVLKGPFDIKIGKCAVIEDPWRNKMVILDSSKGTFLTDQEGNIIGQNKPQV